MDRAPRPKHYRMSLGEGATCRHKVTTGWERERIRIAFQHSLSRNYQLTLSDLDCLLLSVKSATPEVAR